MTPRAVTLPVRATRYEFKCTVKVCGNSISIPISSHFYYFFSIPIPSHSHNQSSHSQLHWLDVPDRVLFKLAVTVHQCLNGRAPPYLSEDCIPVSSADTQRHLRSANRHLLAVPRFRLNTYGRRAFSVAGPMAWNSLPDFISDPTSSTDCFRRLLKTYLFARY